MVALLAEHCATLWLMGNVLRKLFEWDNEYPDWTKSVSFGCRFEYRKRGCGRGCWIDDVHMFRPLKHNLIWYADANEVVNGIVSADTIKIRLSFLHNNFMQIIWQLLLITQFGLLKYHYWVMEKCSLCAYFIRLDIQMDLCSHNFNFICA